jgi:hypothetical protein
MSHGSRLGASSRLVLTGAFKRYREVSRVMAEPIAIHAQEVEPLRLLEQEPNLVRVLALLGIGSVVPLVDGLPPILRTVPPETSV